MPSPTASPTALDPAAIAAGLNSPATSTEANTERTKRSGHATGLKVVDGISKYAGKGLYLLGVSTPRHVLASIIGLVDVKGTFYDITSHGPKAIRRGCASARDAIKGAVWQTNDQILDRQLAKCDKQVSAAIDKLPDGEIKKELKKQWEIFKNTSYPTKLAKAKEDGSIEKDERKALVAQITSEAKLITKAIQRASAPDPEPAAP